MKIDIRKIMLVLWLCTGLTLHFSSSSIEIGTWTQAYAMDDDDDWGWDDWDIDDWSGWADSYDGDIEVNVWSDADDFFANADPDVIDDVFESFDYMDGYDDNHVDNLKETYADELSNNEAYQEHLKEEQEQEKNTSQINSNTTYTLWIKGVYGREIGFYKTGTAAEGKNLYVVPDGTNNLYIEDKDGNKICVSTTPYNDATEKEANTKDPDEEWKEKYGDLIDPYGRGNSDNDSDGDDFEPNENDGNDNENPKIKGDGTVGQPYVAKEGDVFSKNNIPPTMKKQIGNSTCFFATMEYINHLFGGNLSEAVFLLNYMNLMRVDYGYIQENGVYEITVQELLDFINNNGLDAALTTDIIKEINKGNVVMTNISSKDGTESHSVVIVGYRNEGDYIYMNPETGMLETIPPSNLIKSYVISIKGLK